MLFDPIDSGNPVQPYRSSYFGAPVQHRFNTATQCLITLKLSNTRNLQALNITKDYQLYHKASLSSSLK